MNRFRVGWWDDRHDEEVFRITLEAEDESDAEKKFYEIVENDPDIDNYDDEYPFLCEEIGPDDEYYDDLYDEDE